MSKQFHNHVEKIVERGKIDTPNRQIHDHDRSISWYGTDISIQSGGVKLIVCCRYLSQSENNVLIAR
jgi:hypothetical protein